MSRQCLDAYIRTYCIYMYTQICAAHKHLFNTKILITLLIGLLTGINYYIVPDGNYSGILLLD